MSAHYTPTTWVSGTTPCSAPNMNNIENGIVAVDNAKADLAGATFTGALNGTSATFSSHVTGADVTLTAANAGLEMGDQTTANNPHVDFHSDGSTTDYNSRISATGGTPGVNGSGTLNLVANALQHNGNTVWDSGNDGPGSGLEADRLRSAGSVGIKTNDNGVTVAVEVAPDTGARHLYLGGRDSGGTAHFGVKVNSTTGIVDFITGTPTVNGGAAAVAITGSHSAGGVVISYGTGVPAALAANEIYIQLS